MHTTAHILRACLRSTAFWLCAFCAEAAAILILSVIPALEGGVNGGPAAHMLAYCVFSCTAGLLLTAKKTPLPIVKGALIAALFGACVELVQYFIPFRSCEPADFAANIAASLAGMAAAGLGRHALFQEAVPGKNRDTEPTAIP